ncbi:MAG: glycosyltransferase [Clostridia bacterium]|nr:glycosyltransferase [Clostridia bacterium]
MHGENNSIKKKEQPRLNNKSSAVFLSIIIPVYNCEKYVSECLDSCLKQDLSYDEYEIICINDSSTDESGKIIDEYAEKFDNITAIHQQHAGVSSARNAGINKARGSYIWFVDADDFIGINILKRLRNICDQSSCDHLLFKGYYFISELSNEEKKSYESGKLFQDNEFRYEFCTHRLFKLKIIMDNNLKFLTNVSYGEDQIFNFIYYKYSNVNIEYPDIFYFHRNHSNSVMHNVNIDEYLSSIINGADYLKNFAENESIKNKSATINYLLSRINYAYDKISQLNIFKSKKYIKQLSDCGYCPFVIPDDIKNLIKNKTVYNKRYYIQKRIHYIVKYKIILRIINLKTKLLYFLKIGVSTDE